jgi:hypothetical protein
MGHDFEALSGKIIHAPSSHVVGASKARVVY